MTTHAELQEKYVDELKQLLPRVLAWWSERAGRTYEEFIQSAGANTFEVRWIGGPASHPSIIHVFRKYYFAINDLNYQNEERFEETLDDEPDEQSWGVDSDEEEDGFEFYRPVDLLIHDLEEDEPEIHAVMLGLAFVPVGLGTNRKDVR